MGIVNRKGFAVPARGGPLAEARGETAALAATVGLMWGPSTIALMGLGVFIGPLRAEFGWSRTEVSLVATVLNVAVVVMSPIQGLLVDRFGSRKVILPSLLLFSAGLMLLYFLPAQLGIFYLAWALIAATSAGLLPGSFLRVAGSWFDKRLGLAMGVVNSGIGFGNIFVPLIASAVIASYGWRMAYVTLGLIVLCIVLPICWLWLKETGAPPETEAQRSARKLATSENFAKASQTSTFRILATAFFLLGLVNTALISQQVPILMDAGVTPSRAALIQSFFGASLLVGRIGAGLLLDRLFAPLIIIATSIGAAIACLIYSTGPNGMIVFLPAALLGLVVGAEFDVLGYLVKRYFGMSAFGKLYGIAYAIFTLGGAIGVAAFAFSRGASGSYTLGLYGFAAVLVLASLTFASLPRYPEPV
jgi:MFS family permease